MRQKPYENWIHFDFKGMIPSEARLMRWIRWAKENGFSGLVLEYEDRLPWKTFEGTWRPGFDLEGWQRIWRYCAELGLQVTPLIQTYGHLEWLLKHDRWAHLRCGGHVNLLCPFHEKTRPTLAAWIDEVAALHPESEYLHVGLDEVYHMAECPECEKQARLSPLGKMGVLLEHARFVCDCVSGIGKRPILWADMFLRTGHTELLRHLPENAVICEWTYSGSVGLGTEQLAAMTSHDLMGASAIRRVYPPFHMVADVTAQVDNVRAWQTAVRTQPGVKILLHTVWGRSRGLSATYGPWEGWLPAFQIAGMENRPLSPVMEKGLILLSAGLKSNRYEDLEEVVSQWKHLRSEDEFEQRALKWWELALRHHAELLIVQYYCLSTLAQRASAGRMGEDSDLSFEQEEILRKLRERLGLLGDEVKEFLQQNEWSDAEHFCQERFGILGALLSSASRIGSKDIALNTDAIFRPN